MALILAVLGLSWGRALGLNFGYFRHFLGQGVWLQFWLFCFFLGGKAVGFNFGLFGFLGKAMGVNFGYFRIVLGRALGLYFAYFGHFLGQGLWLQFWLCWAIFGKALGILLFLKLVLGNASGLIGRVLRFFFGDARLKFWQALRHWGRSLLRALHFARSGPKPLSARANPLCVMRVLYQGAAYLQCLGKDMTGRAAPQRWLYLSPSSEDAHLFEDSSGRHANARRKDFPVIYSWTHGMQ